MSENQTYSTHLLNLNPLRGTCSVTIEFGGSGIIPVGQRIPDGFRFSAKLLLDTCVVDKGGLGGFITEDAYNLLDWVFEDPWDRSIPWLAPPPVAASFMTVTLSGPDNRNPRPGNYDLSIPEGIAKQISEFMERNPNYDRNQYSRLEDKLHYWTQRTERMERGGTTPWWQVPVYRGPEDTIYQCDMDLGSPLTTDCSQVLVNQLSSAAAASDTLSLALGVTFFHANTCYLAISAGVALVLSWAQVRVAVTSLMDTCLHHSHGPAQGGRAYVGSQPKQVRGRKGKKIYKRQDRTPAGSSALPPHVNITIFEQREPWTDPVNELRTCTWQAVADGQPVSKCTKGKGT